MKFDVCLDELSRVVAKLVTSRNNVSDQLCKLPTYVRDNALNVGRIHDADDSEERNGKTRINDLRANLTEHILHVNNCNVTKTVIEK